MFFLLNKCDVVFHFQYFFLLVISNELLQKTYDNVKKLISSNLKCNIKLKQNDFEIVHKKFNIHFWNIFVRL